MATPADVLKMIKDKEVKFVDLRFTDTRGKEQHVTVPARQFTNDKFEAGHAFDGSSIAGWKGIQASDMLLMPDPATANIDPFMDETTLLITCDVVEPSDGSAVELPWTEKTDAARSIAMRDCSYFIRLMKYSTVTAVAVRYDSSTIMNSAWPFWYDERTEPSVCCACACSRAGRWTSWPGAAASAAPPCRAWSAARPVRRPACSTGCARRMA